MMYYLRLFVRTLYISLFVGIIVTVSYLIYDHSFAKDMYEASAGILVNEDVNSPYVVQGGKSNVITDTNFAEYLLNMAIHYINTPEIQSVVIERLNSAIPNIEEYNFKKNITCSTYASTNVITVTASYQSNSYYPVLIANTMVQAYKELTAKKLSADYFIFLSEATENTTPINMSTTMGCIVYGGGSFVLTYILILLIDALARSEGTYLTWRIFRRDRKRQHSMKEAG